MSYGECGHGGASTAIEIIYQPGLSPSQNSAIARQTGLAGLMPRTW